MLGIARKEFHDGIVDLIKRKWLMTKLEPEEPVAVRAALLLLAKEDRFKRMLERHGKSITFSQGEIECVDPTIVEPMVIFTVSHVPLSLKPI